MTNRLVAVWIGGWAAVGAVLGGLKGWFTWPAQDD